MLGPSYPITVESCRNGFEALTFARDGLTMLEFITCEAHIRSANGGATHASNRATPGRPYLLSALRSTLFRDVFAASQKEE